MNRTDQAPFSKTEEQIFQFGFVLASTCPSNDPRLIQVVIEHYTRRAENTPGMQVILWTDGKITRFWTIDPKHTLRPFDPTLRPCAFETTIPPASSTETSGGAGPTIRSAPPDVSTSSVPPDTTHDRTDAVQTNSGSAGPTVPSVSPDLLGHNTLTVPAPQPASQRTNNGDPAQPVTQAIAPPPRTTVDPPK